MLGIGTVDAMIAGDINSCALGVSLNAAGVPSINRRPPLVVGFSTVSVDARYLALYMLWPWTEERSSTRPGTWSYEVWNRFDNWVSYGQMTIEQLADYIRSVEPECGTCNRFQCTCQPILEPVLVTREVLSERAG